MIAALLTGIAASPGVRVALRYAATVLAVLLFLLSLRRSGERAGRLYHYAPYEATALRRLTTKYGIGEAFLDRLLRERRFVDLFAVVRGALIGSEPNYSIKSMEAFYGRKRDGEVKTAGGSVVGPIGDPADHPADDARHGSAKQRSDVRIAQQRPRLDQYIA